jgi:type II secretory pathway component PulF
LFFLAGIFYAAGPTLSAKLRLRSFAFVDWLAWRVPWKRKRMQRNFGAMLAILLDHGVPEAAAVRLAADCAANEIFRRRAARVGERLAQGQSLTEAVHALDDAGAFRWRLTNAVHAHGGFVRALRGWLEALDARAFQQEQAAAHVLSTTLVVVNGVVVGCVCAGVFGLLSQFIEVGTLW